MIVRSVTERIKSDKNVLSKFLKLPGPAQFHSSDVDPAFTRYISRLETLIGNEVANQLNEKVKKSKDGKMEQLREVKSKSNVSIKTPATQTLVEKKSTTITSQTNLTRVSARTRVTARKIVRATLQVGKVDTRKVSVKNDEEEQERISRVRRLLAFYKR